jgi:hypothetical protein
VDAEKRNEIEHRLFLVWALATHIIRIELHIMECVVDMDNAIKNEVTTKKTKVVSKKDKVVKNKVVKDKVVKPKSKSVQKKPRRRRPLKRTAMDKLQLRLVDYNKRLEINRGRLEILEKKVDTINHEMSCRLEESSDNIEEDNTVVDNTVVDNTVVDNTVVDNTVEEE